MSATPTPEQRGKRGLSTRGIQVRLFLTCWIVFGLHFSAFVTREQYLLMSIVEHFSPRVDKYEGLHSDLATIPGRGTYLMNNPGASIAAAPLYWVSLPVMNRIAPVRPVKPGEKVSAEYKEEKLNNLKFYRTVRARGLDVRLGAVAGLTAVFFMAPLAALSVVLMFRLLGHLGFSQKALLWLTLLYAFGTPIFFRAATLSLNLLVTILGLAAFALLWWPAGTRPEKEKWRYMLAGFLAGYAVLTDYSGAISAAALGLYAFALQVQKKEFWPGLRDSLWYLAGAAAPLIFLLYWQWLCFGNPWLPAQFHMPTELFKGLYETERGVGWPKPVILWDLMFAPLYGLLVFAPIFTLTIYHFALLKRGASRVPLSVAVFTWTFTAGLAVFLSCIYYTVRHQWQDGVRYIVPTVPFLFLLLADVLMRIPRWIAWTAGVLAVLETWCLAMAREGPLDSLVRVFVRGPELPWLTTLIKTAKQYAPWLEEGASPFGLFLVVGLMIWAVWKVRVRWVDEETKQ
jgi:hypothetical protein